MNIRNVAKWVIRGRLFLLIEPYGHLAEAVLANVRYGFPGRRLKVIGVTGTNGKTTTCFMIYEMLRTAGHKVGLMTTVAYGVGDDVRPQMYHMTTVPTGELLQRLHWMKRRGVTWLVLEMTSHALAQYRAWGVPISVAVMTNVTHEHLSYHGTFERYRAAKVRLFKLAGRNHTGLRTGVVNADDPSWHFFADAVPHAVSYGVKNGELRAADIRLVPDGSDFRAMYQHKALDVHVNLPGSFNVANALAAVATGVVVGLSDEQIVDGIAALTSVEGRMARIDEGQNFEVIIDYAHSPDSFEKLFTDLRPTVKGKMIAVFGSLGGGDTAKRAQQGALAGRFCDEVVLTEEDDRQEDPEIIMNDIAVGAEKAGKVRGKDLFLVHDRPEAISFACQRAKRGDMVLLLGKGHEKTIEHADGEHPWDEAATARAALHELKH